MRGSKREGKTGEETRETREKACRWGETFHSGFGEWKNERERMGNLCRKGFEGE